MSYDQPKEITFLLKKLRNKTRMNLMSPTYLPYASKPFLN